ncbi:urease accessory protein UreD [Mycolicibacterium conceptionense]|jgi:urease accessory protein|uniref:Urease accessory protein UreD n=3 Tax=Mycolicibacterium TaxID=1866885 RepID=A0ABR5FQV0_9MYCO|nr:MULTISPECIES: urease accessory protein UreD [Mycolicibacterium]KLI07068.1 urease accessory protein UreD [Mycolicibacterium senegalense]KLO50249.1 urease accessory protein UreD [Mycolicibacterium senegalense]KMV19504.1 urease accessory protein UreD [Mycolicibacterium conceptionense]OBK03833.1 urease accessory protein UreD [Mycolicibacterium conceptionense]OMB68579.1 urease accessory protein UreD [Mycolicibacterium conceptionense]
MHARVLIAAAPGRLPRIEACGGLAGRCTGPDTVHLVSTAATPLGGDTLTVRLVVEPGARLRIRTVAATMVLPGGRTAESAARWELEVAGSLDLDPQPTVVAGGSAHHTDTRLQLAESAQVRIRERVQIGRSGEREGFWSSSVHADIGTAPLLRHRIELGRGAVGDDVLAAPRACVSELRYPASSFEAHGLVLALARGGSLATWQGDRLPPEASAG